MVEDFQTTRAALWGSGKFTRFSADNRVLEHPVHVVFNAPAPTSLEDAGRDNGEAIVKFAKALVVAVSVWLTGQVAIAESSDKTFSELIAERLKAEDWSAVDLAISRMRHTDAWKGSSAKDRAELLFIRAVAVSRRDGKLTGNFLEVLGENPDHPKANLFQFEVDVMEGAYEVAVERIARFSHIPEVRDTIPPASLKFLVTQLIYYRDEANLRTLVNALAGTYAPPASRGGGDFLKVERARFLLAEGRKDEAMTVVATIVSPYSMIQVRTENDFRDLWRMDAFESVADIRQLFEAQAAALPEVIAASPEALQPVEELIDVLLALGDTDAAFVLTQRYADRIFSPRNYNYTDVEPHGRRVLRAHAILMELRGDLAGARRMYLRAALGDSTGQVVGPSVNQMFDEMERAVRLGKDPSPDDWLGGADLSGLSDSGYVWIDVYKTISDLKRSPEPVPQISLEDLGDEWMEAPMAHLFMFLYLEQESTGELMITILKDPAFSRELVGLAQPRPALVPDLPGSPGERMNRDFQALLKRADIAVVLSKAGRLESYPGIYRLYPAP